MKEMIKAYGIKELNQAGWIEVEKPTLKGLDAILRPIALAPCSSDTHALEAKGMLPVDRVLGHEAVAEVVEVADDVHRFKVGDIVVVPASTPDWEAVSLQEQNANNAHDHRPRGSFKFLSQKNGVMAEFFHVNNADANLAMVPEGVSIEQALMVSDMMTTGFYGAEMADIKLGDNVVVFGIGPVGLMAIAGARLLGAAEIIGIGTRPNCVTLAKEYGATNIISYKDGDLVKQVRKLFPDGVDAAIIAGGNTASLEQAMRMVRANGNIANINFFDATDTFEIPALSWGFGMSDVTIRGGFCPGGARRMEKLLNLIKAKRIDPAKLLNYRFEGFDRIGEALQVMAEKPRDLIKPIVTISWD